MKITEAQVLGLLDELRSAAIDNKGYAPALRAIELMGRHIGMWRDAGEQREGLAELIAGVSRQEDGENKEGGA